ncbi:MAG TPA: hypothetical protein VK191_09215, partial [Symbiobacteriaceae bacterium]|nr:hypothetical protein [Symbiobacteriaceae bacterium]
MRSFKLGFLLIMAIATLSACSHRSNNAQQNVNPLPKSLQQKVNNLKADLEARGFEVGQGYMNLFTIEDCTYMVQTLGNCLGNNPAAPYIAPSVPLWPDEYADPKLKGAFGPMPNDT